MTFTMIQAKGSIMFRISFVLSLLVFPPAPVFASNAEAPRGSAELELAEYRSASLETEENKLHSHKTQEELNLIASLETQEELNSEMISLLHTERAARHESLQNKLSAQDAELIISSASSHYKHLESRLREVESAHDLVEQANSEAALAFAHTTRVEDLSAGLETDRQTEPEEEVRRVVAELRAKSHQVEASAGLGASEQEKRHEEVLVDASKKTPLAKLDADDELLSDFHRDRLLVMEEHQSAERMARVEAAAEADRETLRHELSVRDARLASVYSRMTELLMRMSARNETEEVYRSAAHARLAENLSEMLATEEGRTSELQYCIDTTKAMSESAKTKCEFLKAQLVEVHSELLAGQKLPPAELVRLMHAKMHEVRDLPPLV